MGTPNRKMARHSRRRRSHTRRAHRGGGAGQGGYTIGGPITPGFPIGNTAEIIPRQSCLAEVRPGTISFPTTGLGLPGMSGGARRRYRRSRTQKGGRYTFDLSQQIAPAAPWAGGIPQVVRIPCEGSTPNPLNPGPHTPSTQPPMRGGAGALSLGSPSYYAPTAGYTNSPSSWVGSTGAPSLLQIPYDARAMNPACIKTGGGKRKRRNMTRRRRS
jgi:hypothetical protein